MTGTSHRNSRIALFGIIYGVATTSEPVRADLRIDVQAVDDVSFGNEEEMRQVKGVKTSSGLIHGPQKKGKGGKLKKW